MKKSFIVISLLICIILGLYAVQAYDTTTYTPEKGDAVPLNNPYIGYVPWATQLPIKHQHSMAYVGITHKEIEPQKGFYDFSELEKRYNFDYCRKNNIKIIFRLQFDVPNAEYQPVISDWLLREINYDGTWYRREGTGGFSPNFENPIIMETHKRLINALGERYNNDSIFAFIEVGSLGRYGEWYFGDNISPPDDNFRTEYVNHYVNAFSNIKLLMRRTFPQAADNKLGLFNDSLGDTEQTNRLISWITNGEKNHTYPLVPMPEFWNYAPSGGEFAQGYTTGYLESHAFDTTKKQIMDTHISFIGPCSPYSKESKANVPGRTSIDDDSALKYNSDILLMNMGYRLRIKSATVPNSLISGSQADISVVWQNDGVAPLYYKLPVTIELRSKNGKSELSFSPNWDTRRWISGETEENLTFTVPYVTAGSYDLYVNIKDKNASRSVLLDMKNGSNQSYYFATVNISR